MSKYFHLLNHQTREISDKKGEKTTTSKQKIVKFGCDVSMYSVLFMLSVPVLVYRSNGSNQYLFDVLHCLQISL